MRHHAGWSFSDDVPQQPLSHGSYQRVKTAGMGSHHISLKQGSSGRDSQSLYLTTTCGIDPPWLLSCVWQRHVLAKNMYAGLNHVRALLTTSLCKTAREASLLF